MKHLFFLVPLLFISFVSCNNANQSKEKNNNSASSNTSEQTKKSDQKIISDEISKTSIQQVSESPKITFDNISQAEITKNNNSDGGNNLKLPLEFSENGYNLEISGVFTIQSPYGKKNPVNSPPNAVAGTGCFIKLSNSSQFDLKSLMLNCIKPPSAVTLIGYDNEGEEKYKEKIEIKKNEFTHQVLNFNGISSFYFRGSLGQSPVVDDLIISQ